MKALLALALVAATLTAVAAQARPAKPVATITLSPSSGVAGGAVAVTGAGFPARATGSVSAGGPSVTFTVSRSGTFTASVTIPEVATGTVTVAARAGTAGATAPFTVVPERTTPVRFGVSTPGGPLAAGELDAVTAVAGEAPSVVMWYADFLQPPPLAGMDAAAGRGATPMITWEPWRWGGGTQQPEYALARIASGAHDAQIRTWATALAGWGRPVLLRFAHEMNADWYPWSEAINGNRPGDYVAAWRRVHGIFAAAGAANVRWVWSPNVVYAGSLPLSGLYPGAAYVDVVGVDGYNWGASEPWSTWQSPAAVFGPTLAQLRALAPGKPLMLAETASTELGGSKAAWISELLSYLAGQPDIETFVWFDHDKETDWRIASSSSSAAAFAAALAARR